MNDFDICPICLLEFIENKCITNCNHVFCDSCLENWIDKKKLSCPICRQDITYFKNNTITTKLIPINTSRNILPPETNHGIVIVKRNTYLALNILLTLSIMFNCMVTSLWWNCEYLF